MKRQIAGVLCAAMLIGIFSGCGRQETSVKNFTAPESGEDIVCIQVENYGEIKIKLFSDLMPKACENFTGLAESGYYNELTFHRVIPNFMIQGGDPKGNGTGGSDKTIRGEFSKNGVENNISHKRGVISMARSQQDNNSASSQFFIMHKDGDYLDGSYAAFGHVSEGMDVVDKIAENTPVTDSNGTVLKENQPIIEKIVITD